MNKKHIIIGATFGIGRALFEKVAEQIIAAIHRQKSKAYVTKRWHVLAIINKNLPFAIYKRI